MARRGDGIYQRGAGPEPRKRTSKAVRRIKNHGKWTWQARVAYRGVRRAAFRATREEALDAYAELLRDLKASAAQVEQDGAQPATVRQLLEFYVADLTARGKGEETTVRAETTLAALERCCPELLAKPVGAIGDRDIFTFRLARGQEGVKPSTINRDLRTLRAALKKARPGHRFPEGAFFPEDETRVRWLRPDEELTVLATLAPPSARSRRWRRSRSCDSRRSASSSAPTFTSSRA